MIWLLLGYLLAFVIGAICAVALDAAIVLYRAWKLW